MNLFILSIFLISLQIHQITCQYEKYQQPNQPMPVDFEQFQHQQQQIASNLQQFNREQDYYLKEQIRAVHQEGNDPHFQFVVNDNYTDLEHASEQFVDVGNYAAKQVVAPKVIKITKTVAVKIPVPYPISVDRPVYVNPSHSGQSYYQTAQNSRPKTQHHSNSPYKVHHNHPELQGSQSAPPPAVYDTRPFYLQHNHENIQYVPVPVFGQANDNAAHSSEYNQYNQHEVLAQSMYSRKPSHQVSSYSSGSAMTPPTRNYRFELPQEQETTRQAVKHNQHHINNPQVHEEPEKSASQKEEEPEYQTHYYYKPQELNTLEEYAHEKPTGHKYEYKEQNDIHYGQNSDIHHSHQHPHIHHNPQTGQTEYIRYVYE